MKKSKNRGKSVKQKGERGAEKTRMIRKERDKEKKSRFLRPYICYQLFQHVEI